MSKPDKLMRFLCTLLLLAACGKGERYVEVIPVTPLIDPSVLADPPRASRQRNDLTLASFRTVGDLQTMVFSGDFDQAVQFQHHQIMQQFGTDDTAGPRRSCSMFAVRTGRDSGFVGRNYDNTWSQVLAGWFFPADGYASVALLPLRDLGFTLQEPFDPGAPQHRRNLLYGPVMAIEGMNEKGVTVTLASLERQTVIQDQTRPSRFLIHLVREILDDAASVHEAVAIADRYNVFDNGPDVISHHILLSDPYSGSAVLEWREGAMRLVKDAGDWQVVTNSPLSDVPLDQRRRACDRYDTLCDALAARAVPPTWQEAMDMLVEARQDDQTYVLDGRRLKVSTQWSAIFDTGRREILLSLGKDYRRVYRLAVLPWPAGSARSEVDARGD